MKQLTKTLSLAGAAIAVTASTLGATSPAFAASRDGVCNSGEFCYYYNSGEAGSISDFTGSLADYGTAQPDCYDFKGAGAGKGLCIKNNAASVWNRSTKTVRVYFNSSYGGTYQSIAAGAKANLNATLKNNNASHQFVTASSTACSTSGLGDPRTCSGAVSWANRPPGQHVVGHRHVRPRRGPGVRLVQQRVARRLPALDPGAQHVQARG